MATCKVCHNTSGNTSYFICEMMFGNKELFEYFQCGECGCLQIKDIPENIKQYYAGDYYSFHSPASLSDNFLKAFFKHQRAKSCFLEKNVFRKLLSKVYRPPEYFEWLKKVDVTFESEILDVGGGAGHLLVRMKKDSFQNLTGVDAFIDNDIHYENGVIILKKALTEIRKQFDFIMLHHSFEHMHNPVYVLKELHRLLKPDRFVLIRIPVASSYAWETFRENWIQLDAPRPLFLHTVKSMNLLAEQTGFELEEIVFDSTEFQFWGSEQYRRGISLRDKRSLSENRKNGNFRAFYETIKIDGFGELTSENIQKKPKRFFRGLGIGILQF